MTIHVTFLDLFLFVLTITTIIVTVYLVGLLKQLRTTLEQVSSLLIRSEDDLIASLKSVEQITGNVENISQQVDTMVGRISGIASGIDTLLQPLGSLLAGLIRRSRKSHSA